MRFLSGLVAFALFMGSPLLMAAQSQKIPSAEQKTKAELVKINAFIKQLMKALGDKKFDSAKTLILDNQKMALEVMLNFSAQAHKARGDRKQTILYTARFIKKTLPDDLLLTLNSPRLKAEIYLSRGMEKLKNNQCTAAIPFFKQALTVAQKSKLAKYVGSSSNVLGYCYNEIGKNQEALIAYKNARNIWKKLGSKSAEATSLNNIAQGYAHISQYPQAIQAHLEALTIRQKLKNPVLIAQSLHNLGFVYFHSGQNFKALEFYQKALSLKEKHGTDESRAITINNIGEVYMSLDQYTMALNYIEKAHQIRKDIKSSDIHQSLADLASIHKTLGHYKIALDYYQRVLKIHQKAGRIQAVAQSYEHLGTFYHTLGNYDRTRDYYQQALTLNKKVGATASVARILQHFSSLYTDLEDFEQALKYNQEALTIRRKLNHKIAISESLNSMGIILYNQKKYAEALTYYTQALDLQRELGNYVRVGVALGNISIIHQKMGDRDKSLEKSIQALNIIKKSRKKRYIISSLNNLASNYSNSQRYAEAIKYYKEALKLTEELRQQAQGTLKRSFLARQIKTYKSLLAVQFASKDYKEAFQTFEATHARYLTEQIAKQSFSLPTLTQIQSKLPTHTAALLYGLTSWDTLFLFHLDSQKIEGQPENIDSLLKQAETIDSKAFQVALKQRKLRGRAGKRGVNLLSETPLSDRTLANLTGHYRQLLSDPDSSERERKQLAQLLYQYLIQPWEKNLEGKKELLIVPDGVLGFIPFETLIDSQSRFLGSRFNITYSQSMSTWNELSKRKYEMSRKPLLAFGGATYQATQYQTPPIDTHQQLRSLKKRVWQNPRDNMKEVYGALMAPQWDNLPGSEHEVKGIKDIISESQLLLGSEVNEAQLKRLNSQGELARYKVLHFAVHGLTVDEIPELSALVLSQHNTDTTEDNYLRMDEIAKLNLKADFVNLSACDTGLGRIQGGEGIIGLTQAFQIAGANGVLASLWKVDDEGTSVFMQALYKKAQNMNYSQAVQEIKRQFMKGDFGEKYTHPYYWAPFVYYGK